MTPSILDPASPNAQELAQLFRIIFYLSVAVFLIVEGMILYAVVKFRHKPGDGVPDQVHGHPGVEIAWTVTPAIIVIVLAAVSERTLLKSQAVPPNALAIEVTGHRWWWEFHYPDADVKTATDLYVPVGRPVRLELDSVDVIHSFWAPQLAGKLDAIPGARDGGAGPNSLWFTADRPGRFEGQCAEFCGTQHAGMRFSVVAVTEAEFDAWLDHMRTPAQAPAPGSPEARGLEIVSTKGCQGCHTIGGVETMKGTVGPNLTHVMTRPRLGGGTFENTPDALESWIDQPSQLKPGAIMPDLNLSQEQVRVTVAYLSTLR